MKDERGSAHFILHPSSLILSCMAELSVAEAAATLGVSQDTIRRWIRGGRLVSRRDAQGHVYVQVMAGAAANKGGAPSRAAASQAHGHRHSGPVDIRRQLAHFAGLLREVQRQRDQLEAQVAAQASLLEQAAAERAALLERLRVAQEQLDAALGRELSSRQTQRGRGGQRTPRVRTTK
jgi:excisionase family DNA binding protein